MTDNITDRDPIEMLATEFVDRYRDGESPTIEDYTRQYPHLADEIRDLFPTIAAMENLKVRKEESTPGSFLALQNLQRLGDYRLIREIGRGGMGVVYEAEQESLGRRVAVKILPRQSLLDEKGLQRFKREAQTAAKLHHTNIVPIFGVGEQEGHHYFVMQLIPGVGLDQVVAELRRGVGGRSHDLDEAAHSSLNVHDVVRAVVDDSFDSLTRSSDSSSPRNGLASSARVDTALSDGSTSPSVARINPVRGSRASEDPTGEDRTAEFHHAAGGDPTDDHVPSQLQNSAEEGSSGRIDLDATNVAPDPKPTPKLNHLGAAYWRSVARIGSQVASALEYAHSQGTLHRDIKPGNLLLDAQGVIWVADFGLAKAVESENVSHSGDLVGTLRYMAPEQFDGETDHRSDIYALGLTLYELVALRPAHDETLRPGLIRQIQERTPDSPRRHNPNVPRDLETIVLKAIAHNPADRYQSAADLDHDLQAFLEDRPIRARRLNPVARMWRWCRRNREVAALSATAVLLLVAVAVVASWGYVQTSRALAGETVQRRNAESTRALALEALESIYSQFAPSRLRGETELTVEGDAGQQYQVAVQPVLSKEVAVLLENMLVFYDRLAEHIGNADEARQKSAEANRRVGEIRYRLGQFNDAKTAFLKSIGLYESFDDKKYAVQIASLHNRLGDVHRRDRDRPSAEKSHETALRILEKANDAASTKEVRFELARTYYNLVARIPETGGRGESGLRGFGPRFGGRGSSFGRGFDRKGGRSRGGRSRGMRAPEVKTKKGGKSRSAEMDKQLKAMRTRIERVADYKKKAVQLLSGLINEHPQIADYKHLLARVHRDMSSFRVGGASDIGQATVLLRELVADHPDVADYQFDLATTLTRNSRFRRGASGEVEKQLEEAISIGEALVQQHPNIPDYARGLAISLDHLGQYFRQRRDETQARIQWASARKIYEQLTQRYPDAMNYHVERAWLVLSIARSYLDEGDSMSAIADLEKLVSSLKFEDGEESQAWLLTMPLVQIHRELAVLYYENNDRTKGDDHYDESNRSFRAFEQGAAKRGIPIARGRRGPPSVRASNRPGKKSSPPKQTKKD